MKEKLIRFWNETLKPRLSKGWLEFRLFVTSFFFLKNFAAMVGTVILLISLTFWWLRCYTRHGESHEVHDYRGMQLQDAARKARDGNFRVAISDSLWIKDSEPNVVISQDPKPFSRVKENRTIYLKISRKEAPEELLPPLTGGYYDYNSYKKRLNNLDIDAVIKETVFDAKQAPNTIKHLFYKGQKITESEIKEGFKVPRGSTLEFVVTTRGGNSVELPDLTCMSFSAAEFILSSLDLNVEEIEDPTVYDKSNAYVWKQVPAFLPGERVQKGTFLKVYLTQDIPVDCN